MKNFSLFSISRHLFKFGFVFFGLFYVGIIVAQPVRNPETYFSPKDYKAGLHNYCFAQDKRGLIYAGNQDVVLEFDGNYWRKIEVKKGCNIYSISVDSTNRIFVGGNDEFGILIPNKRGHLEYTSLSDKLTKAQGKALFGDIIAIYSTVKGVYFVGRKVIYHWTGKALSPIWLDYPIKESFYVNKKIFITNETTGVSYLSGSILLPVSSLDELAKHQIIGMLPFRKSQFIIVTANKGFFVCKNIFGIENKPLEIIPISRETDNYLMSTHPVGAKPLDNDRFGVYTNYGGIFVFDKDFNLKTIINKSKGLKFNRVRNIFADHDDFLWAGFENGMERIDYKSEYSFYNESAGIDGSVISLIRFKKRLIVGTTNGIFLQHIFPSRFEEELSQDLFSECKNINGVVNQFIEIDSNLYAITSDGFYSLNVSLGFANLLYAGSFTAGAIVDSASRIIALSGEKGLGIYQLTKSNLFEYSLNPEFPQEITSIIVKPHQSTKTLWIGTKYSGIMSAILNRDFKIISKEKYGKDKNIHEGKTFVCLIDNHVISTGIDGLMQY